MKRLSLLGLSLFILASCADDPVETTDGYLTDGLALPEVKTALILSSYNPTIGHVTEVQRLLLADAYPGGFTFANLVNSPTHPFYVGIADTIAFNQPLAPAPSMYISNETITPDALTAKIESEINRKPLATVNHIVTANDTAWLIDSKLKFWKDTTNPHFRIETYMLVSTPAARYNNSGVDFTISGAADVLTTPDTLSIWALELNNLDSTRLLTTKDDPFYHQNILVQSFNSESPWGTGFDDYTPFGATFSAGDIIGTKTTPVRHYFLKPDSGLDGAFMPGWDFKASFLTVIWVQNRDTFKYEYINSVMTNL